VPQVVATRVVEPPAMNRSVQRVRVVDSHTGGEPTRVVVEGAPSLTGTLAERLEQFRAAHDRFRSAVVNEPRGSDVMVGALLLPPTREDCAAATIFFNNVGYLGMCGHGTIGLVATLQWLGWIGPGDHRIETPVGVVKTRLHENGEVSVENVPAYRHAAGVSLEVPGIGSVTGDVAWGGNWFFLVADHGQVLELANVERLTEYTWAIRQALDRAGITGANGAPIDHVELFGRAANADSRNFVLCPGKAYDRSPCGTGTSAKLACLHADDKLASGQPWRQQSITGSVFEGSYRPLEDGRVVPTITGRAYVNAEATLLLDPDDPCCWGIGVR
jgi:4-hydroxyproline epimerase